MKFRAPGSVSGDIISNWIKILFVISPLQIMVIIILGSLTMKINLCVLLYYSLSNSVVYTHPSSSFCTSLTPSNDCKTLRATDEELGQK